MRKCDVCLASKETRPYGKNGTEICFDCAMAKLGPNIILTGHGPIDGEKQ